jgi:CheY-like chemotaxis protein
VKTILIVDDELGNAEALGLLLEDEGFRVLCAYNGQEGLAQVNEVLPDLVILDYMMPLMNGGEVARKLRENEATRHIKIIMNSSLTESSIHSYFPGYDAFIRKPYSFDDLLTTVHTLLS